MPSFLIDCNSQLWSSSRNGRENCPICPGFQAFLSFYLLSYTDISHEVNFFKYLNIASITSDVASLKSDIPLTFQ